MSYLKRKLREREFLSLTRELLDSDQVRMMGRWKHHGPVTTLDHSLFVAFSVFRIARMLRLDVRAAVRGALLHDLYLYDSRDKSAHPGRPERRRPHPAERQGAEHHPVPHVAAGGRPAPVAGGLDGGPGGHHLRRAGDLPHLPPLPPAGASGGAPAAARRLTKDKQPPVQSMDGRFLAILAIFCRNNCVFVPMKNIS